MGQKIIPFKRTNKHVGKPSVEEPALSVEGTIHEGAKNTLTLLEDLIHCPNKEPNHIYTVYSQLIGLTRLREVKHHGLSANLIGQLYEIEEQGLKLMQIQTGIEE